MAQLWAAATTVHSQSPLIVPDEVLCSLSHPPPLATAGLLCLHELELPYLRGRSLCDGLLSLNLTSSSSSIRWRASQFPSFLDLSNILLHVKPTFHPPVGGHLVISASVVADGMRGTGLSPELGAPSQLHQETQQDKPQTSLQDPAFCSRRVPTQK